MSESRRQHERLDAEVLSVSVKTGARLHFGLLANRPQAGREFGGIGMMVDQPGWTLTVARSERDEIHVAPAVARANAEAERRAMQFLARYRERCPLAPSACRIDIDAAIPGHQGLGSGTQLGLAIAKAMAVLEGADGSSVELARRIGRGRRSAIGIWGFDLGGFLVDGGKLPNDDIGSLVGRFDVPREWRFVLVSPLAQVGLSGAEELAAFGSLAPMTESTTQRLSQLVLTSLLPALGQGGFDEFATSLFEYGRVVGEYFAPAQGGVFASSLMAKLADELLQRGLARPVQTSWGPTCAVPCRSLDEALRAQNEVTSILGANAVETRLVEPLQTGAEWRTSC